MKNLFYVGVAMILFDALGHFFKYFARINYFVNILWNKYADKIWFTFSSDLQYDFFWAMWFFIALTFIIIFRD